MLESVHLPLRTTAAEGLQRPSAAVSSWQQLHHCVCQRCNLQLSSHRFPSDYRYRNSTHSAFRCCLQVRAAVSPITVPPLELPLPVPPLAGQACRRLPPLLLPPLLPLQLLHFC
jgi:hypothetical protein